MDEGDEDFYCELCESRFTNKNYKKGVKTKSGKRICDDCFERLDEFDEYYDED